MTMASVGSAVRAACLAVRDEVARRAIADQRSPVFGAALEGVEWIGGNVRRLGDASAGQPYRDILASSGQPIEAHASNYRDPEAARRYSMHSFGASAPAKDLFKHFGFTVENVVKTVQSLL